MYSSLKYKTFSMGQSRVVNTKQYLCPMDRYKSEVDMQEELREDLIKMLYEWGFPEYNIARAFDIQSSLVFALTERLTPTEHGVCKDDGWLMEELMRMGITKQEVSELFGTDEVYIDSYIEKYHSKEIAV